MSTAPLNLSGHTTGLIQLHNPCRRTEPVWRVASRLHRRDIPELVLRWLLDHPHEAGIPPGLLIGLSHPKLARALTAVHEQPGAAWSLASMADVAGMSRSAFAAEFKARLGTAPAEYLLHWRVSIARSMLIGGSSVKAASSELGYASTASFSRAFAQVLGSSPRAWLQDEGRR